jgi:hypothetical protein
VDNVTLRRLYPRERVPVCIVQEDGIEISVPNNTTTSNDTTTTTITTTTATTTYYKTKRKNYRIPTQLSLM